MANCNDEIMPKLGATFTPGGFDDYTLPVEHPKPQRVMLDMQSQISSKLAHLELEDNHSVPELDSHQTTKPWLPERNKIGVSPSPPILGQAYLSTAGSSQIQVQPVSPLPPTSQTRTSGPHSVVDDMPTPSPFSVLKNPSPNVPPSDDQREDHLWESRHAVLNSNNPDLQLDWARDALQYCDIAVKHEERVSYFEGTRSQTPKIEHELREDAIRIVRFLADQTHPKAEFMRGKWLEFGTQGFRIDKKEAFRCYARSAEKRYPRAEYRLGMQYENVGEQLKAISHYQKGAALNDSASNYRLGMLSIFGQHGQPQDFIRGVDLIRQAAGTADTDFPQGAFVYGMLLARDLECVKLPEPYLPYDIKSAKIYIERAAYLGFAKAQQKMGLAYELSQLGCPFDAALSLHYNALAAKQDVPEADMSISKWFLCGYDGIIQKNDELAFTHAQRAAMNELPTAEFAMGYFFEIGMYVNIDLQIAKDWYRKAAAHGNQDAASRIEGISRSKTLSRKDHESVALAKIRSTHGSQKEASARPPHNASLDDTTPLDPGRQQPPAATFSSAPLASQQRTVTEPPPRVSSATPYPLDDGPPLMPSANQLSTGSGGNTPDFRPNSAFGLHPSIQLSPITPPQSAPDFKVQPPYPTKPDDYHHRPILGRPAVSNPNLHPSQSMPPQSSTGSSMLIPPASQIPPAGARPLSFVSVSNTPGTPPRISPAPSPGYSTPPHGVPAGAARIQKLPPQQQQQNQQVPLHPTRESQPINMSRPPQQWSAQDSGYPPFRISNEQARFDRPVDSAAGRPPRNRMHSNSSPMPPPKPPKQPIAQSNVARPSVQSGGRPPPQGQNSTALSTQIPGTPGKGPQSFEEMGIPSQKQGSECRIM